MINSQSICKPDKEFLHFAIILTILQKVFPRQIVAYCNYFLTVKGRRDACALRLGQPGGAVRIPENLRLCHHISMKFL